MSASDSYSDDSTSSLESVLTKLKRMMSKSKNMSRRQKLVIMKRTLALKQMLEQWLFPMTKNQ